MFFRKNNSLSDEPKLSAWVAVFTILIFSVIGAVFVGPLLGLFVFLFFDGDFAMLQQNFLSIIEHPEQKMAFLVLQGVSSTTTFVIAPLVYTRFFGIPHFSFFNPVPKLSLRIFLSCLVILLFVLPNSVFIEWNEAISFPDFLPSFASWAREQEDMIAQLTLFLTTFHSWQEFVIVFFIVAIIPGIGEELLFRGLLQPAFHRATKNIHVSILLAAILFSAIHLQFFGFFPRLFIGILLGYMYYWSKNLLIPIAGHMINNGFALTMIYLRQLTIISLDLESKESAPWLYVMMSSVVIVGLLIYLQKLKKYEEVSYQ